MSSLGVQLQIDFDRFVLLESGPNGSPLTLALGHSDGVILVVTDRCPDGSVVNTLQPTTGLAL